ncbi:helix-turn-helix domain-containing protein [Metabacillus fastidiosus]|uniref:helix-turn-helix domain-containing protein n=1 Tax=Metabacillus fastidiosus TaxID=1458 RepID=UPI003D2A5456
MSLNILSIRLKWLREKKRLSQKEIAAEIGVKTVNAYQKWEYGEREPKLETLGKLAKLFEVSADFILGLSDDTPESKAQEREIYFYREYLNRKRLEFADSMFKDYLPEEHKDQLYNEVRNLESELFNAQARYVKTMILIPFSRSINEKNEYVKDTYPFRISFYGNYEDKEFAISIGDRMNHEMLFFVYNDEKEFLINLNEIPSKLNTNPEHVNESDLLSRRIKEHKNPFLNF